MARTQTTTQRPAAAAPLCKLPKGSIPFTYQLPKGSVLAFTYQPRRSIAIG